MACRLCLWLHLVWPMRCTGRHEIFPQRAGDEQSSAVRVEDEAFPVEYLDRLRQNILAARDSAKDAKQSLGDAFVDAYTFEFTATLSGIAFASAVLGLPLQDFFHRALDPSANAFFMNALVVDTSRKGVDPPFHDFAIDIHDDASLEEYVVASGVNIIDDPGASLAKTVTVLYLSDVDGGELEIYNDSCTQSVRRLEKIAENAARGNCQHHGKSQERMRNCERLTVDAVLKDHTLARIRPKSGRLVHFDGRYKHAARTVRRKRNSGVDSIRVSFVLEQYFFPDGILRYVPVVESIRNGMPFFLNDTLRKRFLGTNGQPLEFGLLRDANSDHAEL